MTHSAWFQPSLVHIKRQTGFKAFAFTCNLRRYNTGFDHVAHNAGMRGATKDYDYDEHEIKDVADESDEFDSEDEYGY